MFEQLRRWANNASSDEQRLRDISLEYREAELTAMARNFDPGRRLGSGNYGAVYRGTMPDGHDVAIKVMEVDDDSTSSSGFAEEVQVLSKFRHPNLVTLMGWGTGRGRRYLVYELLEGGDVSKRLLESRERGRPFGHAERLWVALDSACGLSHMHNSTPKAFHRDIKSANILLDRSGTAKMADFGLSGIAKNKGKLNMTVEQVSGTPGYACPHYIKSGRVTEQTEVYAFGMVLLELLMNAMPACMGQAGQIIYPIFQTVMPQAPGATDRALGALDAQAAWPQPLAKDLVDLALACSSAHESRRPTFVDIGRRLRHLCEQHCRGQRPTGGAAACSGQAAAAAAGPPTAPQMHSQMARGQGAAAGEPPTRPQVGGYPPAAAPPPGGEPPTRPQLGLGGAPPPAGGEPPTRPQLGSAAAGRGEPPTRPQLGPAAAGRYGPDGQPPTNPQVAPPAAGRGPGPPTQPQMGLGTPAAAPATSPQGYQVPAVPRAAGGPGGGPDRVRDFFGAVQELWHGGWEGATEGQASRRAAGAAPGGSPPANLAEVVLECVHASGVDVWQLPLKHKCLVLQAGEGPWTVGRQQQPNLFARLVPDESLRACISRSHVVFRWERPSLFLRKLSPNALLVNGRPAQAQEVPIQHDTKISFCGRDNATPFLAFVVLLRDAAAVTAKGPTPLPTVPDTPAKPGQPPQLQQAAAPQRGPVAPGCLPATTPQPGEARPGPPAGPQPGAPPVWYHAGSGSPFSLVCTMAMGCDAGAVPPERRTISLKSDQPLVVGRQEQQGFFEGLLGDGAGQRYLCCVSRAHLELRPMVDRCSTGFEVMNLSPNPVRLRGSPQGALGKGERAILRARDALEFLGAGPEGKPIAYLRLELEERAGAPGAPAGPPQVKQQQQQAAAAAERSPAQPPAELPGAAAAAAAPPAAAPRDAAAPAAQRPVPEPLLPSLEGGQEASRPVLSQVLAPTAYFLTLSGSAVREDFPAASRKLDVPRSGLTVGRAHQPEVHSEAFDRELRQYLSRDHFRIECGQDGDCRLVPLSNNPIWRARRGELTEAIRGEPALPLTPGDAIQLFTGAEDCTPDGPGSQGTLRWLFLERSPGQEPPPGHAARGGRLETVEERDVTPPPRLARRPDAQRPGSVGGAMRAPVPDLKFDESPAQVASLGARLNSLDDSQERVNDKFSASGFSFN